MMLIANNLITFDTAKGDYSTSTLQVSDYEKAYRLLDEL
jgi:hypothetical protein